GQILQEILDLLFADAPDEILEALVLQALAHVVFRDRQHRLRYPLGWNGANGYSVFPRIVVKFSAKDHLKMRHLEALHVAVDAVKADVGNMMLAAGVKAAANFNAQIFYRLIELQALLTQSIAQLPCEPTGRCDSQFARIRPWARCDVHNSCSVRRAETDGFNSSVKLRQIRFADPAEENVL